MFTVSPTQDQIFQVLVGFLTPVLPASVEVVRAQVNRVPEPRSSDFVVMTMIQRARLMAQDVDDWGDVSFNASIAGNLMTVTAILIGGPASGSPIGIGQQVFGTGLLASGTLTIISQVSGSAGGSGTYQLSGTATIPGQVLAAGIEVLGVPVQLSIQLDVHGPASADNSSVISAVFRDDYSFQSFAGLISNLSLPLNSITGLYADEAKQVPFINDQNQYEDRWIVQAELEVNQVITIPLQFFTATQVALKEVDAIFPP